MKPNHIMCISKILTYLYLTKLKKKKKKNFSKSCLQCFSSKNVLNEHNKICLKMNCEQAVKLGKGTIQFKNYFKQIAAPCKTHADF